MEKLGEKEFKAFINKERVKTFWVGVFAVIASVYFLALGFTIAIVSLLIGVYVVLCGAKYLKKKGEKR